MADLVDDFLSAMEPMLIEPGQVVKLCKYRVKVLGKVAIRSLLRTLFEVTSAILRAQLNQRIVRAIQYKTTNPRGQP